MPCVFLSGPDDIIRKYRLTPPAHFLQPQTLPHKIVMTHFGWNSLLVGVFKPGPSQKNVSKKLRKKRERNFLNFSKNCIRKIKNLHFQSKVSNVKLPFLKLIKSIAVFRIRGFLD